MASHHHDPQASDDQQEQQNPTLFFDTLYCSEEKWEEEVEEQSFCSFTSNNPNQFPILRDQDLFWDDEELSSLFCKEEQSHLADKLQTNPSLARGRREAVEWMLRVNAHYSFSALTAVIAVSYLDRFLISIRIQEEKPWMTQLAAVACLSIAAKVEETAVPLLLDLQVEESRFVFEAKAIQRMEILVLSTLAWKMNPVTAISFLDYITRRLGLKNHLCWEFIRRCERILLSVIPDSRFMRHLPSVMAAATVLHVVNGIEPSLRMEYENQLLRILGIDKEKVEDCSKFIAESETRGFSFRGFRPNNKRKHGSSIPGSPNCVVDATFSSDSSNDSWSVSASPEPEPLSKKSRAQEQQLLKGLKHANATTDVLSLGR